MAHPNDLSGQHASVSAAKSYYEDVYVNVESLERLVKIKALSLEDLQATKQAQIDTYKDKVAKGKPTGLAWNQGEDKYIALAGIPLKKGGALVEAYAHYACGHYDEKLAELSKGEPVERGLSLEL